MYRKKINGSVASGPDGENSIEIKVKLQRNKFIIEVTSLFSIDKKDIRELIESENLMFVDSIKEIKEESIFCYKGKTCNLNGTAGSCMNLKNGVCDK